MCPASSTLKELPSLEKLTGIYANAMTIRLLSERLMVRSIQLERLAINTEIVAVKASKLGQPFTVIAKEVSSLARTITEEMGELLSSGDKLAAYAVTSAARARVCEKYEQALSLGLKGNNQAMMIETRQKLGVNLLAMLEKLEKGLRRAHENSRNLTRLSVHIPVVASMFRIESARADKAASGIFRGMSEELVAFTNNFSLELEDLLATTADTLSKFKKKRGAY